MKRQTVRQEFSRLTFCFGLLLAFHRSNVQSCSSSSAFWTSACFTACPTSNPPLQSRNFGPSQITYTQKVQNTTFHMMFWTSALYNLIYTSNQRLPIKLLTFSFCFCNCSACLYADMLLPVYN